MIFQQTVTYVVSIKYFVCNHRLYGSYHWVAYTDYEYLVNSLLVKDLLECFMASCLALLCI